MRSQENRTICYQEAIDALAVCEIEVVSEAQRLDPDNNHPDLMARVSSMIDAMEAYVGLLFDVDNESLREDVGQVDPQIIRNYMDKRAMHHMETQGRERSRS